MEGGISTESVPVAMILAAAQLTPARLTESRDADAIAKDYKTIYKAIVDAQRGQ